MLISLNNVLVNLVGTIERFPVFNVYCFILNMFYSEQVFDECLRYCSCHSAVQRALITNVTETIMKRKC